MIHLPTLFQNIADAGLPMSTELVGLKLLALALQNNGSVDLTWDEFMTLCRVQNARSAARHLTRLKQAGLIHFATGQRVHVQFIALAERVERQNQTDLTPPRNTSPMTKPARLTTKAARVMTRPARQTPPKKKTKITHPARSKRKTDQQQSTKMNPSPLTQTKQQTETKSTAQIGRGPIQRDLLFVCL